MRDALKLQLSADTTGFNDRLAAAAGTYGIEPWAIDWSPDSVNLGTASVDDVLASGKLTFPYTRIEIVQARNTNRVKFSTFSGPVTASIEITHSWPESEEPPDTAPFIDATVDTMLTCLSDQNVQPWVLNLNWNGMAAPDRGKLQFGGQNWIQTVTFVCNFELYV